MKTLIDLKEGEKGLITGLDGGHGFINKLEALGIRKGVVIEKKSSQFMKGPVCIKIGACQVALGFGMARRIFVKETGRK